jgi:hypothetical protein
MAWLQVSCEIVMIPLPGGVGMFLWRDIPATAGLDQFTTPATSLLSYLSHPKSWHSSAFNDMVGNFWFVIPRPTRPGYGQRAVQLMRYASSRV